MKEVSLQQRVIGFFAPKMSFASNDLARIAPTAQRPRSISPRVRDSMPVPGRATTERPALFDAIEAGSVRAVRTALKSCDVNEVHGQFQISALYRALSACHVSLKIVNLLLDAGADPQIGMRGKNVLHALGHAPLRGIKPEALSTVIKRCVAMGADLEQRTEYMEWTPLMTAVSLMNPIATEALLLAGADLHARAGDAEPGPYAGADIFRFAEGDKACLAVLNCFGAPQ